MSIFKHQPELTELNAWGQATMVSHLGIEIVELGEDFLRARMPVDARTRQPFGLLHGGASIALAETLGSIAGQLTLDANQMAVGLEINGNHVRAARSGWVFGTARALHLGGRTQVWEIRIENESGELTCISRITLAIVPKPVPSS